MEATEALLCCNISAIRLAARTEHNLGSMSLGRLLALIPGLEQRWLVTEVSSRHLSSL